VVETIIIVAGFAILAAGIYTAVSGKVQTWIAKMP
jgi:thioredoxin reductase